MIGRPRVHLRIVDSTNARARELARGGAPHGTLVTAGEQTAGRGRQGRSWAGAPGGSLLMSLVLREHDALLPLRAGLAVSDVAGGRALVKWPNDVLVGGRKVAGILVEGRPQEGWAVLGIGVNVAVELADLPEELRDTAGTLGRADLEPFLTELLTALEARLREPPRSTVAALRARDALRDRAVRWNDGEGTGVGIDDGGRLLVRTGDSLVALDAGEVHLRAPEGAERAQASTVSGVQLPTGRITIPDGVVRRQFGEDKVLLNLATGHYHGLNPTGGYMVALLEETGDAEATATRTARELDTPIERVREDLAALCAALTERGLIHVGDAGGGRPGAAPQRP